MGSCSEYELKVSLSQDKPPIKVISTLGAIAVMSSDEDLIDAAIMEIESIPLERRIVEDPAGQADLVLYAHAVAQGDHDAAFGILEAVNHAQPSDQSARNRLAKSLISSGKAAEAIGVLANEDKSDDSGVRSEMLRLQGISEIMDGEEGGLRRLQESVRAKPWDEEGWRGLAWGRKITWEAERA